MVGFTRKDEGGGDSGRMALQGGVGIVPRPRVVGIGALAETGGRHKRGGY